MKKIKNTILLLRFPFSVYLLPVYLFAISQVNSLNLHSTISVLLILHLLIYPSSNGYNSYMDQDTDSIGGLEKPPAPTKTLLFITNIMDMVGVFLSIWLVNLTFGLLVGGYIIASRSYSSKNIRLKKYPITSFLVVFIFQGAYSFLMVSVGAASMTITDFFHSTLIYPAIISSLMIGGGYPLTQIYQHKADAENGDKTLSMILNYKGTFIFSLILFTLAIVGLLLYLLSKGEPNQFILFQICTVPLILWFFIWMRKVWKKVDSANFKNTMIMNNISAICLNGYYSALLFMNHYLY